MSSCSRVLRLRAMAGWLPQWSKQATTLTASNKLAATIKVPEVPDPSIIKQHTSVCMRLAESDAAQGLSSGIGFKKVRAARLRKLPCPDARGTSQHATARPPARPPTKRPRGCATCSSDTLTA